MRYFLILLLSSWCSHLFSQSPAVGPTAPVMHRQPYSPAAFYNSYSSKHPVALRIMAGDTIATESLDAMGIDKNSDRKGQRGNPLTGPFFIEGAEPGDWIAVTITQLSLNRNYATTLGAFIPRVLPRKLAKQTWRKAKLVKWNLDLGNNTGSPANSYDHLLALKIPLHPFLGCVGVAPEGDRSISSGDSGPWGGNMDYKAITRSSTVYLPVYHPGALLFLGDGHAAQGDGELNGDALETSMNFSFTTRLVKGKSNPLQYPRVEDEISVMAFGIGKNLDIALKEATLHLIAWLQQDYQLSLEEASQLIGPTIEYDIPKLAATKVEVVAKLKKELLRGLVRKH